MKLALVLLLAGFSRALSAQTSEPDGIPVLSLSEIVLEQYAVQHADPEELLDVAMGLVGREYFVAERGGSAGGVVTNLRQLGRNLIVYDTPDSTKRALAALARLDVPRTPSGPETKVIEYAPRFVSLKTVIEALKPLNQDGVLANDVEERGLVVVRAPATRIPGMLELLARVDVPEKQVLVTCLLLGTAEDAAGPALPRELADNLAKLLPERRFEQLGMALLQTSVASERAFSLGIETASKFGGESGATYQLSFQPLAFDAQTGALTVERCMFREVLGAVSPASGEPAPRFREIFTTNTTFRSGEYTVLAATGADPFLLLAVRVTPLGG